MQLSKHGMGTYQATSSHETGQGTLSQSSQLAEPLWADPGLRSGISVRELISTLKKKKPQAGNELSSILPKSFAHEEKATTTTVFHASCTVLMSC